MKMKISFPEGKKVIARYNGFTIETDQAKIDGGSESAPTPYSLFMASIGTCAGAYVLYFCHERSIDASGIEIKLQWQRDEKTHLAKTIALHLDLPATFPAKYKAAVIKAADLCTVKRNMLDPPRFITTATIH